MENNEGTSSFQNLGVSSQEKTNGSHEDGGSQLQGQVEVKKQPDQDISVIDVLKRDFKLTDEQIGQLKDKGVDLEKLNPEDLAEDEKRKQFFEKIQSLESLTEEQKQILTEVEQLVSQKEPTREELQEKIFQKRKEIEESTQLSEEEKKQALAVLDEMEKSLQEPLPENQEGKENLRKKIIEKASAYIQYAGIGLGVLFFILMLKGFTAKDK